MNKKVYYGLISLVSLNIVAIFIACLACLFLK